MFWPTRRLSGAERSAVVRSSIVPALVHNILPQDREHITASSAFLKRRLGGALSIYADLNSRATTEQYRPSLGPRARAACPRDNLTDINAVMCAEPIFY